LPLQGPSSPGHLFFVLVLDAASVDFTVGNVVGVGVVAAAVVVVLVVAMALAARVVNVALEELLAAIRTSPRGRAQSRPVYFGEQKHSLLAATPPLNSAGTVMHLPCFSFSKQLLGHVFSAQLSPV
jgi:hypothetical protein